MYSEEAKITAALFLVLGVGLIVGITIGVILGEKQERSEWCRLNHTTLTAYEKCINKPDYKP